MTFLEHKMRFQPEFTQLFSNGITWECCKRQSTIKIQMTLYYKSYNSFFFVRTTQNINKYVPMHSHRASYSDTSKSHLFLCIYELLKDMHGFITCSNSNIYCSVSLS